MNKLPDKRFLRLIIRRLGVATVAKLYGVSTETVYSRLDERGTAVKAYEFQSPAGGKLSKTQLKIAVAVRDGCNSISAISAYASLPRGTVGSALKKITNGDILEWQPIKARTIKVTPAGLEFLKKYGIIDGKLRESEFIK